MQPKKKQSSRGVQVYEHWPNIIIPLWIHRKRGMQEYLSSKLRSISNWYIDIRLGESSTVSPLLALSYIFSPPTWFHGWLTLSACEICHTSFGNNTTCELVVHGWLTLSNRQCDSRWKISNVKLYHHQIQLYPYVMIYRKSKTQTSLEIVWQK
jgi:hypothetical protein